MKKSFIFAVLLLVSLLAISIADSAQQFRTYSATGWESSSGNLTAIGIANNLSMSGDGSCFKFYCDGEGTCFSIDGNWLTINVEPGPVGITGDCEIVKARR